MRKILLCISVAILGTTCLTAQTETDTTSGPIKIRVYSPNNSLKKNDNSYKWAIKTDLVAYLTGEFGLSGEYRFSKKFSAEVGAGVTYAFLNNELTLFEDEGSIYNTKPAMGTAFRGTVKFYPSSDYDAIEGWSFGIQVFSKTTNREYDDDNSNVSFENKKDSKVKTGISLIISKQIFQDSNIAFESYIGVGIANSSREYYADYYNPDTQQNTVEVIKDEKSVPNFQLGFKIGFGN